MWKHMCRNERKYYRTHAHVHKTERRVQSAGAGVGETNGGLNLVLLHFGFGVGIGIEVDGEGSQTCTIPRRGGEGMSVHRMRLARLGPLRRLASRISSPRESLLSLV